MRDRLTLYNFGDGAAAVVRRASRAAPAEVPAQYAYVGACLGAQRKPGLQVIGGGTDLPLARQSARKRLMDIRLDAAGVAAFGPSVFVTAWGRDDRFLLGYGQPRSRIGATTASVTVRCAGAQTSQPM
jgi:3-oxoacyl-[acyl-carrier-protein] synthase-3